MALTPGHGPWVLFGSVVTDAELAVTEPMQRTCGTCTACIPACPTGAIVAPGMLDAARCLAAVLQSPGDIPVRPGLFELRHRRQVFFSQLAEPLLFALKESQTGLCAVDASHQFIVAQQQDGIKASKHRLTEGEGGAILGRQ